MTTTVTRNKDGVPGWGGEPSSWNEYKAAARLYVASTKFELRYTCGPRLAAELTGAARTAIQGQRSTWLSSASGAEVLLRHLQDAIGEPALPEVGNFMRQYFRVLRRKKGESMTSFCVRHREEYDRMCRSLGRMLRENGDKKSKQWSQVPRGSGTGTTSVDGSDPGVGAVTGSAGEAEGSTTASDPQAAQTTPGGTADGAWTTSSCTWNNTSWYSNWWYHAWASNGDWQGNRWGVSTDMPLPEDEEEDDMIQVLPDAVQGWFLLDKCGLDPLEKSVIQGDLKGNFTLAGVENSLRSHWTDDQVKKRDGEPKYQAHLGNDQEDDVSAPEDDPDDAYFENWTSQEISWYQDARAQEHEAWLQFQQARRTLRDARARQHEVRMGRKFYRPGGQKGGGKQRPIGAGPPQGPCLQCGKAHRTRDCPQNKDEQKGMASEELAEFTYYFDEIGDVPQQYPAVDKDEVTNMSVENGATADLDNDRSDEGEPQDSQVDKHDDTSKDAEDEQLERMAEHHMIMAGWEPEKPSTEQAIVDGMAVLDSGATRTMGSIHAVEKLMECNQQRHGQHMVNRIDQNERPTFGFGNSAKSQSLSTCYIKVPCASQDMQLKVHVIPEGQAPVLISIDTLKKLGAIIDYRSDEVIFTSLCDKTVVPLMRSRTGHQLLPLGADPLSRGKPLKRAVCRLSDLCE